MPTGSQNFVTLPVQHGRGVWVHDNLLCSREGYWTYYLNDGCRLSKGCSHTYTHTQKKMGKGSPAAVLLWKTRDWPGGVMGGSEEGGKEGQGAGRGRRGRKEGKREREKGEGEDEVGGGGAKGRRVYKWVGEGEKGGGIMNLNEVLYVLYGHHCCKLGMETWASVLFMSHCQLAQFVSEGRCVARGLSWLVVGKCWSALAGPSLRFSTSRCRTPVTFIGH